MNEVAASIIYIYVQNGLTQETLNSLNFVCFIAQYIYIFQNSEQEKELAAYFNSFEFAEADIYSVFEKIMNQAQHMEMFRPNYTEQQKIKLQSKKPSAILTRVAKIQDIWLKQVDLELFRQLKLICVEFQIFLLKWIRQKYAQPLYDRCMFTRELQLLESFKIWDAIFYEFSLQEIEDNCLFLVDCIAIALIQYIKPSIMVCEDSSQCYQKLLKYTQIPDLRSLVQQAFQNRGSLKKLQIKLDIILNQKSPDPGQQIQFQISVQKSNDEKTFNPVFFTTKKEDKDKSQENFMVIQKSQPLYHMRGDSSSPAMEKVPLTSAKSQETTAQSSTFRRKEEFQVEEPQALQKQSSDGESIQISLTSQQSEQWLETLQRSLMYLRQSNERQKYNSRNIYHQVLKNICQQQIISKKLKINWKCTQKKIVLGKIESLIQLKRQIPDKTSTLNRNNFDRDPLFPPTKTSFKDKMGNFQDKVGNFLQKKKW